MEEIVEAALPDENLGQYYTRDSAEDFLLKNLKLAFVKRRERYARKQACFLNTDVQYTLG